MSSPEIREALKNEGTRIGERTIERILFDEGFAKLPRRTRKEKGLTVRGTFTPPKTKRLEFSNLKNGSFPCKVGGLFLLIPYMLKIGLNDLVAQSDFPETDQLTKLNSIYSMLALKLVGQERLSQISNYSFDQGFGLFAGLNVLPKSTMISTYSYQIDRQMVMGFQTQFISHLNKMDAQYFNGETINLDFHTIPHYGENPPLDINWAGSRNKALKGALTLIAQDGDSRMISYTNTEIDRDKASYEISNFVQYWLGIKGVIDETLVFDSRLTNYTVLGQLYSKIKFITLRRRGKNLVKEALSISESEWTRVKLNIPKRKYNKFFVHEKTIQLPGHEFNVRQVIITGNGREEPTFLITNNFDMQIDKLVECYAHRWRIENKISELVHFFNLNALSSPLMIRIQFDVLMTLIADTCYKLFSRDFPRFKECTPKNLFKKFIDTPGKIIIDDDSITVKLRKRAHTPILKSHEVFTQSYEVPWWRGKTLSFDWYS